MPCIDYGAEEEFRNDQLNEATAIACAALAVLEKSGLMGNINWEESGVTKLQLKTWWKNHKEVDELRRAEEKRKALAERVATNLRKNFTPEELAELKRIVPGFPGI